jgi:hypothetical protein
VVRSGPSEWTGKKPPRHARRAKGQLQGSRRQLQTTQHGRCCVLVLPFLALSGSGHKKCEAPPAVSSARMALCAPARAKKNCLAVFLIENMGPDICSDAGLGTFFYFLLITTFVRLSYWASLRQGSNVTWYSRKKKEATWRGILAKKKEATWYVRRLVSRHGCRGKKNRHLLGWGGIMSELDRVGRSGGGACLSMGPWWGRNPTRDQ